MKKLTLFGITLTLLLSLALWQRQAISEAKAPPPATINAGREMQTRSLTINTANNETTNPGPDVVVLSGGTYTPASLLGASPLRANLTIPYLHQTQRRFL